MDVIVSAVQTSPKLGNVRHNLKESLSMAFEASIKGAKLIVLPELCLSGYAMRDKREAADAAQTKLGYQTEQFLNLSKSTGSHIAFGYVELYNGNLYNSAAVVCPDGKVYNFQKHNLWGSDHLWATPSESLFESIPTNFGRLGVLICRDASNNYRSSYKFYDSNYKFYRKGSVDTLALLTNWGGDFGYPDASWIELSEQLNANVIVSNRIGRERDMSFKGGSCIVDKNKKIHTFGSSFTTECVVGGTIVCD